MKPAHISTAPSERDGRGRGHDPEHREMDGICHCPTTPAPHRDECPQCRRLVWTPEAVRMRRLEAEIDEIATGDDITQRLMGASFHYDPDFSSLDDLRDLLRDACAEIYRLRALVDPS